MLENLTKYDIILGSASPRRKELLGKLNISFRVETKEVDETFPKDLTITQVAQFLAEKKSSAFNDLQENTLLITADTIVCLENKIFGKPKNTKEATEILNTLSDKTHQVITGVSIRSLEKTHSFNVVTNVTFSPLTDEEIAYYITHYQPFDKAGAYGIQEWIGHIGVTSIDGSYFNVMGLPIQRLYQELKNWQ